MTNKYKKIWLASDLHLDHKILTDRLGSRKRGFEEEFFSAWNSCVLKDDVVVLLGDIAFRRQSYWFNRIKEAPGSKILLLGNHDKNRATWYSKWVDDVTPFGQSKIFKHEYGNILLTHVPSFPSVAPEGDDRFHGLMGKHEREFNNASCILNLHGHCHGRGREKHNTFDCSLEVIGNAPVMLEQILEVKFKQ